MPLPPIMSYEDLVALLTEELKSRQKEQEKAPESEECTTETLPDNVIDFTAYLEKINS